jgi:hypothetical protein
LECDFIWLRTDFVRLASDFTAQLSDVTRMLELTADVSNLTTHILSYQPQPNIKTFQTQNRELKSEMTFLKAQHGMRMLDLFNVDNQKMKPAVSSPATVQFASLFDSRILCGFQKCSQCSKGIVLKF